MATSEKDQPPGIVVTSPDPTENVRQIVIAEKTRGDDLRIAESRRFDDAVKAIYEAIKALDLVSASRSQTQGELRLSEARRIDERHQAEADRVDEAAAIERGRINDALRQLRDYVDALRITDQAALAAALAATERAITKNDAAYEKRFDGIDEFRDTLRDQAKDSLPRTEYTVAQGSIEAQVKALGKVHDDAIAALKTSLEARVEATSAAVAALTARAAGGAENFNRLFAIGMFVVAMMGVAWGVFGHR